MTPSPSSQEEARELKACPLCGADAELYLERDQPASIMCKHGHIFRGCYGHVGDEAKMIAAWNTRPTPDLGDVDELVERIDRLRKERRRIYEVAGDEVDVVLAEAADMLTALKVKS
jgi:hypothetical protein